MDTKSANKQWMTRPDEQRFWSIAELREHSSRVQSECSEHSLAWRDMRLETAGSEIAIVGRSNVPAALTHWSFQNLAEYAGAPAEYLRSLSPETAVQALRENITANRPEGSANVLIRANGTTEVRGIASERYVRLWDSEFLEFSEFLVANGWKVPPAWAVRDASRTKIAEAGDTFSGSRVKVGDKIGPAGVYASDRDFFVFLVDPTKVLETPHGRPMMKGVIFQNSEVRAGACKATGFLFDEVCGNHNLFGASEVFEMAFRHVGDVQSKLVAGFTSLQTFALGNMDAEREIIDVAAKARIAEDPKDVVDVMFAKRSIGVPLKTLRAAFEVAQTGAYGDPRSPWAMSQAITQLSQGAKFTADRTAMDRAATKVLTAF